jgi:lipopolysaccharide export system ATP-binding protein
MKHIGLNASLSVTEGLFVDSIGKSFGDRPVVKTVSLRLGRGEVAGLLGPNGAGKTTCFYMITGLIAADYGSIYLDGEDITAQPMYQRARMGVGYLPQEASIFRGMTVEQNVMAVVELRERDRKKAKQTVTELLEELRISHLRHSPAVALSGGERRRVEIARALASEPSFMLLDEPFAGIDPLAISDIREVIGYLKGRGIGILITDHNVRETLDIIDRASIIHGGEVLFEGSPEQILADPEVRRVYLGDRFG